jgi:hypothetical protein
MAPPANINRVPNHLNSVGVLIIPRKFGIDTTASTVYQATQLI